MSSILEKIDQVLDEKRTKIIPENIRKGVTILGVTGTYEGSGGGGDTLPDKLYRHNDMVISFKDNISPEIFEEFDTTASELLDHEIECYTYMQEHKGDADDPEVQAEIARMQEEVTALTKEFQSEFGWRIINGSDTRYPQIELFANSAELFLPIYIRMSDEQQIVYSYPRSAEFIQRMAGAIGMSSDISAVTGPGWYSLISNESGFSLENYEMSEKISLINVEMKDNNSDVSYLEKFAYENIFEEIETENLVKDNVLNITGLSEYSREYDISISDSSFSSISLGDGRSTTNHLIPIEYSGNVEISIRKSSETLYSTTISTNAFIDNYYTINLSGHSE